MQVNRITSWKKIDIGQKTGRNLDPVSVAQEMRVANYSNGVRLFSKSKFLTNRLREVLTLQPK